MLPYYFRIYSTPQWYQSNEKKQCESLDQEVCFPEPENPNIPKPNVNVELMANFLGGTAQATLVTLTGYPFDLIKSRLQSKMYSNSIECLNETVKTEGIRGLYRGSAMPWLSHLLKRPVQFAFGEYLKSLNDNKLINEFDQETNIKFNNIINNFAIGAVTGCLGPVFGTPLQVIKVSMQTSQNDQQKTKNSWSYIKHNYKTNGVMGFYRGFIPTLVKDSVFGMSFVGTYYTMRDYVGDDKWYKNFFNGAFAHCVTWCLFIPIDYVKTTIQKSEVKIGVLTVIKSSLKTHGLTVFWKGVIPACLRTIPVSGIAMIGYESVRELVLERYK